MRRQALALALLPIAAIAGTAAAKPGRKPKSGASDAGASASSSPSASSAPSASASPSSTVDPNAVPAPAGSAGVSGTVSGCVESIPTGATRPVLTETFPGHGISGYAATLKIVVDHGRGENVLPHGLDLQSESEAAKALKNAGFVLPDQDGGAAARLTPGTPDPSHPDRASTIFELPLLALPPEPGRHTLVLPPLPVAVSRANGEIATVCTKEHKIVVEEPTASTPNAQPKGNPAARAQREEWTMMRQLAIVAGFALVTGIVLTLLVRKWLARPKKLPPPPPPRPPWEVALEKLDEVRHAGLLEVARFQEYFDRVNDAVRAYLGSRYGFDGLESTTDEMLQGLRRAHLERSAMGNIVEFLNDCDLVKFANVTPAKEECQRALTSAERIVRTTMPMMAPVAPGPVDLDPRGPLGSASDAKLKGGPPPPPPPPSPPPSSVGRS